MKADTLVIMPQVYELHIGLPWRWCKLREICEIVPTLARVNGINFAPTPEDLVSRFAALAHTNKPVEGVSLQGKRKKIFRYSFGKSFSGKEVPTDGPSLPPYAPFNLDIKTPYPKNLFVQENWAFNTLKAIRRGIIAAVDFGDRKIGFSPRGAIVLEGNTDMLIMKIPDCVTTFKK